MLYDALIAIALAGAAVAFTPPGFEPASTNNLTVAFGNVLAVNGVDIPKADTASPPTVGTTERLSGTYAIMMVDPDIPPQVAGDPTSELLHWMQAGLVSSNESMTVGGQTFFALVNPSNTTAIASYIQPSPPNKSPISHRYTQMLLNTTGNSTVLATLTKFGMTRTNFSAVNVVNSAGLMVLKGNSFNVTAATNTTSSGGSSGSNSTTSAATTKSNKRSSTSDSTATAKTNSGSTSTGESTSAVAASATSGSANTSATTSGAVATSTNAGHVKGGGAAIAGLGAFVALVVLL